MENNNEINNILRKTLQSYFILEKQGKKELALIILQAGSRIADSYLSALRLRENYGKVYCRNCHQQLRLGFEIEFYNQYSVCLQCDKLLAEHDCQMLCKQDNRIKSGI